MFPKWQTSQAWIFTAVIVLLNLRNVLRFGPTPANGYIPVFSVALCKFLFDDLVLIKNEICTTGDF